MKFFKKLAQTIIICLLGIIFLSGCNGTNTKLDLNNTLTDAKTEYVTSFFNIDQSDNPLEVIAVVKLTSGSLRYALADPGTNMIYGGVLGEGDALDETISLEPFKGNYIFNLELKDFIGEYQFTFNQ